METFCTICVQLQFVYNWCIIVQRPIVTTFICCYNHSVWKITVWIERKTRVCTWAHRVITKLLCNLSFQKYYFGYKNKKCFELWTNWWDCFQNTEVIIAHVSHSLLLQILVSPTKRSPHVMLQWICLENTLFYGFLSGSNSENFSCLKSL